MDSLTTFGYDDLKHLHKAFAGTDFSACVDMQYSQQRTLDADNTLRPSSCSLTQTVNGDYQTLKDGTTMKDVVVDNIIVRK